MRRQLHIVGSCRNSFGSQSLACAGSTRDATMSCIADGARDAGSVMQRPAFEGFDFEGNPTLRRFVLRSLRIGTRSGRQHRGSMEASWRHHVGNRCFRLTSKPTLLFFSPGARGQRRAWPFAFMCGKLHVALASERVVLESVPSTPLGRWVLTGCSRRDQPRSFMRSLNDVAAIVQDGLWWWRCGEGERRQTGRRSVLRQADLS
jgi:hypothetical protein